MAGLMQAKGRPSADLMQGLEGFFMDHCTARAREAGAARDPGCPSPSFCPCMTARSALLAPAGPCLGTGTRKAKPGQRGQGQDMFGGIRF